MSCLPVYVAFLCVHVCRKSKTYSYAYAKRTGCEVLDVVANLDSTLLTGHKHVVDLIPVYDNCARSGRRLLAAEAAAEAPAPAPAPSPAAVTGPAVDAPAPPVPSTGASVADAHQGTQDTAELSEALDATPPPSCLVSVRYTPRSTMVRGRGSAPPPAEIGTLSPALPQQSLEDGVFTSVTSEVMLSTADGASKAYTRTVQVSDVRTCSTAGWPAGLWAELTGMGIDLLELGLKEPPTPSPPPPATAANSGNREAAATPAPSTPSPPSPPLLPPMPAVATGRSGPTPAGDSTAEAVAVEAASVVDDLVNGVYEWLSCRPATEGCWLCHSINDYYVPGLWACLSSTDKARLPLPADLKA